MLYAAAVLIAIGALSGALAATAQTVVNTDIYQPGDGGALWDTATDLDWAKGPTGPSGGYEGFRLATSDEVATFFTDAGLTTFSGSVPLPPVGRPEPPVDPTPIAVNLLFLGWHPGSVGSTGPYTIQSYIVADPTGAPDGISFGGMLKGISGSSLVWSIFPPQPGRARDPTLPIDFVGRALVREHVAVAAIPEPSTYALMLMGLLGVVGWRRRAQPAA